MKNTSSKQKKPCTKCGAELVYLPRTKNLHCEYCGHNEKIKTSKNEIKELNLKKYLEKVGSKSHTEELMMLECKVCGANQHIEEYNKSLNCIYCSTPLIINNLKKEEWIVPGALISFQLDKNKSHKIFANWIKGLWFAPNKLKKATLDIQNTKGLYLPYWTFDADLHAQYTGERGEYYYVNVSYTTMQNGKSVRRTRKERRTNWYNTSGSINKFIDDTLIKATYQQKNYVPKGVSNWNLKELEPFKNEYLKGFITEKYTIPLDQGHLKSIEKAKDIARYWIKRDIGGDTQRIHNMDMKLSNETFKHILLPVYISSYKYSGKVYRFYVNGQTGTITGSRPYSYWKIIGIILLVVSIISLIVIIMTITNQN